MALYDVVQRRHNRELNAGAPQPLRLYRFVMIDIPPAKRKHVKMPPMMEEDGIGAAEDIESTIGGLLLL